MTFAWSPNEPIEAVVQRNLFNECYPFAREARLVIAALEMEGVQHVLNAENQWVSFRDMLPRHPFEQL